MFWAGANRTEIVNTYCANDWLRLVKIFMTKKNKAHKTQRLRGLSQNGTVHCGLLAHQLDATKQFNFQSAAPEPSLGSDLLPKEHYLSVERKFSDSYAQGGGKLLAGVQVAMIIDFFYRTPLGKPPKGLFMSESCFGAKL